MINTDEKQKEVVIPKYKLKRSETELAAEVLLPGVKKEDIELNVEGGYLELLAGRKSRAQPDWSLITSKPAADTYKLKIQIHPDFDLDLAKVTFSHNILNIVVPSRVKKKLELNIQ